MIPLRKSHPILKILNGSLIDLPCPINISLMWNFGSLLGCCLALQIMTGLFLSLHFSANALIAFDSVVHISRNINLGWLMRTLHANGASLFFICMFLHIGRGIYYSSYRYLTTWISGILIFLITMITAFLGYVLPWGQMSFWGATVITNLLSAVPYLGNALVQWLWGGFAVDSPTLTRFYSFHFLFPFLILALVIVHLLFLHQTGSSNPLGTNPNSDKIPFHPYFSTKDLLSILLALFLLLILSSWTPYLCSDPENFLMANPLSTPVHIQPEWYFLFAYAILRSIPNKLGGVIALIMSILILISLPFIHSKYQINQKSLLSKQVFWALVNIFILLTWIGARPVEAPYIFISQILTVLYFFSFLMLPLI